MDVFAVSSGEIHKPLRQTTFYTTVTQQRFGKNTLVLDSAFLAINQPSAFRGELQQSILLKTSANRAAMMNGHSMVNYLPS